MAHLFLFLFLCISPYSSQSQYRDLDQSPRIHSAYQDVLKLKLNSARKNLESIIPSHADLGHYHFTLSLADALEIIVTQNPDLYEAYEDSENDHLEGLEEMDDNNPYKKYYSAEIKMHWAIVKTLFLEDLKAGWALRSAYMEIEDNIEEFPEFNPNHKTLGTLQVIFAAVPESYHWILNYLGIKGNINDGYNELNKVNSQNAFYLESSLTKALISLNILNRELETMSTLNSLLSNNKDNLIVHYFHNIALIKYSKSEKSIASLSKIPYVGSQYLQIPHVYYLLGEVHLQKGLYEQSRGYYSTFISTYKGKNHIKDTWFKIFLNYYLENQIEMAELPWDKAKKSGRALVSADKNAASFLENDEYPNKELFTARLATDGGYFLKAELALNQINRQNITSKKDECEYFYRYGRLYDKTGDIESALFNYLNTIKKSGSENWYFAPSSCLQVGYIYEYRNDIEKATYYFKKALSYKKHKYKDGIDHKANSALEMLEQ
ncbi:MAG: hypothetical protein OCD76_16870 [Reichenbachiella sp.]